MGCATLSEWITRALDERRNLFKFDFSVLFFLGQSRNDLIAFIETETPFDKISRQSLAVFCTNIAINLDNMTLLTSCMTRPTATSCCIFSIVLISCARSAMP